MTNFVLFKHPKVRVRKENFGGIAKTEDGLYILNKKAYKLFESIKNNPTYSDLTKNKESKEIIDELLERRIILKIDKKKANEIIKESKTKAFY